MTQRNSSLFSRLFSISSKQERYLEILSKYQQRYQKLMTKGDKASLEDAEIIALLMGKIEKKIAAH